MNKKQKHSPNGRTMIVLVVDRSGSMMGWGNKYINAQNGINKLLKEQNDGGYVIVKLVEFDNEVVTVEDHTRIENVKPYRLEPRGNTRLLDGLGKAIKDTKKYITKMGKNRRPDLVRIMIVSDGAENASRNYKIGPKPHGLRDQESEDILPLVKQAQDDGWHFSFMGEGYAVAEIGRKLGIEQSHAYKPGRDEEVYMASSSQITRMRNQSECGMEVINEYTEEEIGWFAG